MARLPLLVVTGILLVAPLSGCLQQAVKPASTLPTSAASQYVASKFDQSGPWSKPLVNGTLPIQPVKVLQVASFDGTLINLGLYLPQVADGAKVPVLIDAGPYFGNGEGPVDHVDDARLSKFLIQNFVPQGYAVVLESVRGTGNSGGCEDFMGTAEQQDLDKIVTWAGTQPWSNGNVAMIGKSYDGSTPWEAALFGNPHLKTIVPLEGVSSLKALHFVNGTAEARTDILWALYYTYTVDPNTQERDPANRATFVCDSAAYGAEAGTVGAATGDPHQAGADALLSYWDIRDMAPHALPKYNGSIFIIHGLQDWNVHPDVVFPLWNSIHQEKKLLLGQWDHAYPDRPQFNKHATRYDFAQTLLDWFDHYLKGKAVSTGPTVEVEDDAGMWRVEKTWPPADANFTTLFLTADGKLDAKPGAAGQTPIADPAGAIANVASLGTPANGATDMLPTEADFKSAKLASDMRISGMPQVPLSITPGGEGGHVYVALDDIAPNGSETLIGHGYMDLRFSAGGDTEQPVVPGQPMLVKVQLMPMDALVKAGHTLELTVTQDEPAGLGSQLPTPASFPWVLNTGGDAKSASALRLPIIMRDAASFAGAWPYGPKGNADQPGS
ncbi:MAG: CocE/NonD family hydrolase [Thermoplasmatota archaeon]